MNDILAEFLNNKTSYGADYPESDKSVNFIFILVHYQF